MKKKKMTIPCRTTLALAALALVALVFSACNEQRNAGSSASATGSQRVSAAQLAAAGVDDEDLDLGDNWTGTLPQAAAPQARATSPGGARAQSQRSAPARSTPDARPWSIVLNTYSDDNHVESAKMMLANLGNVAPELVADAHIRTTDRGSMVLYGRYAEPDEPRARADLDRVKSITMRDIPVFPRAFLTRAGALIQQANNPHALMSVRQRFPNVDPLYTLQVAAWSDFDTGQMSPEQVRRNAEAYAAELRTKGFEAYFHHEPRSHTSVVTVGLFDRTAYDIQQGDLDPELTRLRRHFRYHLVNGEPLQELIDRRNPNRGTRIQEPRLVLVPRR